MLAAKSSRMARWPRRLGVGLAVALAGYVLLYALNSALGGYWMKPDQDAQKRYNAEYGGLSITDAIIWQPRIGYSTPFRHDSAGRFFRPLAALDQAYWHPTRYLSDPAFQKWMDSELKASQVHSEFRAEFEAARLQKAAKPSSP
jgi:hypothetical protein